MAVESLIRAIEASHGPGDRNPCGRCVVSTSYRSGLLLTPYFYDALPKFQDNGTAVFRDSLIKMAAGIELSKEQQRFRTTFHAIELP